MSGLGDLFNVILIEIAKSVSGNNEAFINEIALKPYEIKILNGITPYYLKWLITLGFHKDEIEALITILVILIPKIAIILSHDKAK